MPHGTPLQPIQLVQAARDRKIHHEMVRILRALRPLQAVEGNHARRAQRVVRFAEELGARDGEPAGLRVHACGERDEVGELRAHGQRGDVAERVEDGERRARVVDDLVREEAREVRVVRARAAAGLVRVGDPLEEEDEGVDGLERGERVGVEGVEVVDEERDAECLEQLAGDASCFAGAKFFQRLHIREYSRVGLCELPAAGVVVAGHCEGGRSSGKREAAALAS